MGRYLTDADRREMLWTLVEKTPTCWNWLGNAHIRGYGAWRLRGKYTTAHRAVWVLLRGEIPEGLQIDHLCRNKRCVNPDHLELVTPAENMRRMSILQTACKRAGHDWSDPRNVYVDPQGSRRCRECGRINDAGRSRQGRRRKS